MADNSSPEPELRPQLQEDIAETQLTPVEAPPLNPEQIKRDAQKAMLVAMEDLMINALTPAEIFIELLKDGDPEASPYTPSQILQRLKERFDEITANMRGAMNRLDRGESLPELDLGTEVPIPDFKTTSYVEEPKEG